MPAASARAEDAPPAAISDSAKAEASKAEVSKPEVSKPAAPAAERSAQAAPTDAATPSASATPPSNQAQPKSLTDKAIERVTRAARVAGGIFSRVPCLPPKGVTKSFALPHFVHKLAAGEPVVIVAFGSSSTQGYGTSSPEFTYPNRLAAQLHRKYPTADITVINRGRGGEEAAQMMKRLQSEVTDMKPDLVIWQVGTNAVLRNVDPDSVAQLVQEGVARIQAAGADVVLVDLQYSPRVTEHPEGASKMVRLIHRVAQLRHIGVFPRFEVMRQWHENQALPIDSFVIADGLHMNDWGYACFAQILGDDIIRSVGQIKFGVSVNVPASVPVNRPM
ncbi:GDSL-type esterase/lipase family protein [Bradyrhizobium sp.]|uniref:SGNH/GDSL hydrolase family protein n=1 Tax=Bradyrhizobium sp. TaxID=376 RepID=UPI00261D24F3|nr:GDSL-type esterase/lipase family protein [Bradyrhizobium sp.]